MDKIGDILRQERIKKGLLLREVAASLSIDSAILSKIERNERKATKEQILKFSDVLDIDKNKLMIEYISDKIAYEIADEEIAIEALKVAEAKVGYLKTQKK